MSCGVEEDATFASTAVAKLSRALRGFEAMLAAELLTAVRALRLREGTETATFGPSIKVLLCVADALPQDMHDRDLRPDLQTAQTLLPILAEAVRNCAGNSMGHQ